MLNLLNSLNHIDACLPLMPHCRRALATMHEDEKNGSDPIIFARAGAKSLVFYTAEELLILHAQWQTPSKQMLVVVFSLESTQTW
jgi:hypothetical protein